LITALFGGRLIGKNVDYFGCRNVMIYDTVILGIVCLMYGFADKIFPLHIAIWVVCINYILDMLISHAAMAAYVYAASLSDSKEELTATLSSGISINHVISVLVALAGGVAYDKLGPGALFSFAAVMAVANTLFATTIPRIKAK
jgi:predicted MFS family arabinose efflux permease